LLAVPRTRILDDRRYTVHTPTYRARFRLQLFTAPGVRPLAVAIQVCAKDPGASLMNGAERYAAAVWEKHFPADVVPPLWIARMLLPGDKINQSLTSFTVVEKYKLRSPSWAGLTDDQVPVVAGAPVALER
jgi:hypothetical protein